MPSQSSVEILRHGPLVPCLPVEVTLRLACGCVIERRIARDRLLELGGELRAVGKYPCPQDHPVGPDVASGRAR